MRDLDEIISGLPAERRNRVDARGAKLIGEETALRQLRRARDLTQQDLAPALRADQARVSRIEKSSDMLISTMRSYVEAMGGHLRLIAEFPDAAIEIATIGQVADVSRGAGTQRRKTQAQGRDAAHDED